MQVKRDPKQVAKQKEKHWRKISGVVCDVSDLLESLARISGKDLPPYDCKRLETIRRTGMLVATHALAPVLEALDNEHDEWFVQSDAMVL